MKKSIITDQISMDLEKSLQIISDLSYDYCEIHSLWGKTIEDLNDDEVDKVKELISKYNVKISCLASTVFFMCPLYSKYETKHFNPNFLVINGNYSKHVEKLKRTMEIAKKLNVIYIRIFPFRRSDSEDIVGTEDNIDLIADKLMRPTELAKDADVTFVLENCPYTHLPKGILTKRVIDIVNSPNLKLLWDAGNSFREPVEILPKEYANITLGDELNIIFKDIYHIHLKDYLKVDEDKKFKHVTLGTGSIDIKALISKLNNLKYDKYISLEPEVSYNDTIDSMKFFTSILND